MSAQSPSSPIVAPQDQTGMLRDLADRLTVLEQTAIIPVGLVAYCAGAVPNGWLFADGSAFDTARYGQLAAYLGSGTLPDVEGRVIVGRNAAGGTFATLLSTGGVETVTLTAAQSGVPAHAHPAGTTGAGSSHTNPIPYAVAAGGASGMAAPGNAVLSANVASGAEAAHTHSFTTPNSVAANAAQAHSNLQPYIVLVPIIKV